MARKRKRVGKRISGKNKQRKNYQSKKRYSRGQPPRNCKREIRQKLKELFGGCCQVCGYARTPKALEFHHVNAKHKESSVSRMVAMSGYHGALEEAMKCILVCANCHREVEEGLATVPREMIRKQIAIVVNNLERKLRARSRQSA